MSYPKVKAELQAIEAKACETVNDLTEAATNLAAIKASAEKAISLDPPQNVKDILQAIKVAACETYDTLAAAISALTAIKLMSALAISLLGK